MNTRNIIIGVLVIGGAYWYWKNYMSKGNSNSVAQTNPISKPQKELAPKPQTSVPNVQPSVASTEVVNSNIKNLQISSRHCHFLANKACQYIDTFLKKVSMYRTCTFKHMTFYCRTNQCLEIVT